MSSLPAPPGSVRRFRATFLALALAAVLMPVTAALSMADTCDPGLVFGVFALSVAAAITALLLALVALVRGPRAATAWLLALTAWVAGLGLLGILVGVFVASTMSCAAVR